MSGMLTPEHAAQLTLLQAVVNDDAKTARIAEILDAQKQAQQAMAALREQEAENKKLLDRANGTAFDAEGMRSNAEAWQRQLDQREKTLAESYAALNDEKTRWEEVRQNVDRDQAAREKELHTREIRAQAQEDAAGLLMTAANEKMEEAEHLAATYAAKHERLHAALDMNESEDADGAA